jgi:hypothetical protein
VGTIPKSDINIIKTEAKLISSTYIYMTAYFLGLVQALQYHESSMYNNTGTK